MVTFRSCVIFMVLAAFLSLGVACSSNEAPNTLDSAAKESPSTGEAENKQPVATAQEDSNEGASTQMAKEEPVSAPKTLALTGTVAQDGDKMVLNTDVGDYILTGQDLSEMIGKTVNVTGAVEEVDGKYMINVLSFTQE